MADEKKGGEESTEEKGVVKVLMVLTSHNKLGETGKKTGWYLPEAAHPYYVFHRQGYQVVFTSPKGGLVDCDEGSLKQFAEDPECQQFVKEKLDKDNKLETIAITALQAKNFQVILYVGGHGTMWDFRDDKFLKEAGEAIYGNGGIVSAVCHGPAGILELRDPKGEFLIKGKKVAGFTNKEEEAVQLTKVVPYSLEDEMRARGAEYTSVENWQSYAVADTRVVTGQNPASGTAVGRLVVQTVNRELNGLQDKEIKVMMVYTNTATMGDSGKPSGWYLPEAAHPFTLFEDQGYNITFVSPRGGPAPCDPASIEAFKDAESVAFAKRFLDKDQNVETVAASALNHGNFQVIFYVGGTGVMWDFKDDTTLKSAGETVYRNGGVVSAVCHGPAGLLELKEDEKEYIISGKTVAGFSNAEEVAAGTDKLVPYLLEDAMKERGANYVKADLWQCKAVADGRVVTGQNPASASECGKLVIQAVQRLFQSN